MEGFEGVIKARIVEARFALSGKIVSVQKHTGDLVKKWDLIASLDRKILQTELDKELADYEKERADFDSFAKKYPDPLDDNKYTKAEKQATLNASVKSVELAKAKLDEINLFAPVEGIIIDDSGIVPGVYTTPAGSSVKIVDTSSYYFEIEIEQKDIPFFAKPQKAKLTFEGIDTEFSAESSPVISEEKRFSVRFPLTDPSILLGMKGKAKFT